MSNHFIYIFRDEKSIIMITYNKHALGGFYFMTDWSTAVPRDSEFKKIGEAVLDTFQYIKTLEPVESITKKPEPWKKHSKHKSWRKFLLNTAEMSIYITKDNQYAVYITHRLELGRHHTKVDRSLDKEINLPLNVGAEEMGRAVVEILDASDAIYKNEHPKAEVECTLLNEEVLKFRWPGSFKFCRDWNNRATEGYYRLYSYTKEVVDEPIAWFLLSPAGKAQSIPTKEELVESWAEAYKSAEGLEVSEENIGLFTHKAEMWNKKVYKLSYFADLGKGNLLECSMEVKEPNRRKNLVKKLLSLFMDFVTSCKIKEK